MILGSSDEAIISMPFKLAITTIVIMVSTAVLYSALDGYYRQQTEGSAETAARHIAGSAREVASMGVGSSRVVELDIVDNAMYRIEDFTVGCGGDGGTGCYAVRYKISGDERWVYVKDAAGNDLDLISEGPALVLGTGRHVLVLEKGVADGGGPRVLVSER